MAEKRIYKFDNRLPSLNKYIKALNANRYIGQKMKNENEELLRWQIIKQNNENKYKNWAIEEKVDILFIWYVKNQKEDKDNITFAKKFILDALQKSRVLRGDGWRDISTSTDIVLISKEQGLTSDYSIEVVITGISDELKTIQKIIKKFNKPIEKNL